MAYEDDGFGFVANRPPEEDDDLGFVAVRPPSGATRSFEVNPMAEIRTGLEKTQREIVPDMPPEELARAGVEGLGMAAGAATGALIPVPGASILGGGMGYAGAKRLVNYAMDEPVDATVGGIAKDVGLGSLMQGAANVVGKIPFVRDILSPKAAAVGPQRTIGADTFDKTAYAMMEKTMKVPPSNVVGGVRVNREGAINTALDEGIPVTKSGLNRTQTIISDLDDQMDLVVASSANKGNLIDVQSVLGPVNELRNKLSNTVNGNKIVKQLDDVIDNFTTQYGPEITVEQAQSIKQNTNALLKKAYGTLQNAETESIKQVVRGLKDRIAAEIPEIAGINAKYSDLKNLERVLERAVNRTGNWDWFSLSAGMAGTVVGGATGSLLKATEAVGAWRLLKSPSVQSHLALTLKSMGLGSQANVIADTITTSAYNKLTGRSEQPE